MMQKLPTNYPQRKLHGSNGIAADVRQTLQIVKLMKTQGFVKNEMSSIIPQSNIRLYQYLRTLSTGQQDAKEQFENGQISFATLLSSTYCAVKKPLIFFVIDILEKSNKYLTSADLVNIINKNRYSAETLLSGISKRGIKTRAIRKAISDHGNAVALGHYLNGFAYTDIRYNGEMYTITKTKEKVGRNGPYGKTLYQVKKL